MASGEGEEHTRKASPRVVRLSFGTQLSIWLIVGVVVAVGVAAGGWWLFGRPAFRPVDGRFQPSNLLDLGKIALSVVAGIGGVVALVVAYRKQRFSEADHKRQERAANRDDQKAFAERFRLASEQLGSEKSAVRLSGIYALAGLADDWDNGRQTCIDVLCAYLRMPFTPNTVVDIDELELRTQRPHRWKRAIAGSGGYDPNEEAHVRSAIFRVIADRLKPNAASRWEGHVFDLSGAVIHDASFGDCRVVDCYFDLRDSLFLEEVDFSGTEFVDSEVDMLGSTVAGRVGFEFATLTRSELSLYVDITSPGEVTFQGATFDASKVRSGGMRLNGSLGFVTSVLRNDAEIEIINATCDGGSLAVSRSEVEGGTIRIEGGSFSVGTLYFSGLTVANGVVRLGRYQPARNGQRVDVSTEIFLNDVLVCEDGILEFEGVDFSSTELDCRGIASIGPVRFVNCTRTDDVGFHEPDQEESEQPIIWKS